jgi:histidine triad (HIT) family protein
MADVTDHSPHCVFCGIISGAEPATIVREWPDALAFVPLGPVIPDGGHVLVVPRRHVADAVEDPAVTAVTMARAAELAAGHEASNILTSVGKAATQSIFHLHVHVIRRAVGDQLMVPWGTTGNPHDPHSCARSAKAEAERDQLLAGSIPRALILGLACVTCHAVVGVFVTQDALDNWARDNGWRDGYCPNCLAGPDICLRCGGDPCSECGECAGRFCQECRCGRRDRDDEEQDDGDDD